MRTLCAAANLNFELRDKKTALMIANDYGKASIAKILITARKRFRTMQEK